MNVLSLHYTYLAETDGVYQWRILSRMSTQCWILQRSVLGPTVFLLVANDVSSHIHPTIASVPFIAQAMFQVLMLFGN